MELSKLLFWKWKPEEFIRYKYHSGTRQLLTPDLYFDHFYNLNMDGDTVKIKPYVILNGKRIRTEFYIKDGKCHMAINKKGYVFPLNRCSFKKDNEKYFRGQCLVSVYTITVTIK